MAYKKMKKQWKQKWLEALRSKKYKRTQIALHRLKPWTTACRGVVWPSGYCPLGVLCEVVAPTLPRLRRKVFTTSAGEVEAFNDKHAMPPPVVLKLVGLTDATANKIADLNDDEGLGFIRMANWIEQNL